MTNCLLLAALLVGVSAPVFAQATAQPADPDATASVTDTGIITAQQVEQRAVDVPITISVNTGERPRKLGVSELDELSNYVPGFNVQEQSADNPSIVTRGMTCDSGSAQQAARVTLHYDGIDISRSRRSYQDFYDVDRIEVIKGWQATLFGTASTVGAISIVSARPQPGVSAQLTGGYGNFDAILASGFTNVTGDKLAVRVATAFRHMAIGPVSGGHLPAITIVRFERDALRKRMARGRQPKCGDADAGQPSSYRYPAFLGTASSVFSRVLTGDVDHGPGHRTEIRVMPPTCPTIVPPKSSASARVGQPNNFSSWSR